MNYLNEFIKLKGSLALEGSVQLIICNFEFAKH